MRWSGLRLSWLALAWLFPLGVEAQWTSLGAGGCRAAGGLTKKLVVLRGLDSEAACREACDANPQCTAVVFGTFDGETICHILGGGPYTHSDDQTPDFSCSAKMMRCSMPGQRAGYSFDSTSCGSAKSSAPQCELQCATGYAGSPSAACLGDGGVFALEGCALLSSVWELHSRSNCVAQGARPAVATQHAASLAQCQAACEVHGECGAVTYHAAVSRCHLFPSAPTAGAAAADGELAAGHPECWMLDPAVAEPSGAALAGGQLGYSERADASAWTGNVIGPTSSGAGEAADGVADDDGSEGIDTGVVVAITVCVAVLAAGAGVVLTLLMHKKRNVVREGRFGGSCTWPVPVEGRVAAVVAKDVPAPPKAEYLGKPVVAVAQGLRAAGQSSDLPATPSSGAGSGSTRASTPGQQQGAPTRASPTAAGPGAPAAQRPGPARRSGSSERQAAGAWAAPRATQPPTRGRAPELPPLTRLPNGHRR